jgi:hypothetical protein
MKKLIASLVVCVFAVSLLTGCAGIMPVAGGAGGTIYTSVNGPVSVGSAASAAKVGMAKSTGIIGFATGDSSIDAAMKAGGITKVHHVDCKVLSVLGVYSEYTTIVYGE